MGHKPIYRLAALSAFIFSGVALAGAQTDDSEPRHNIRGNWTFVSELDQPCTFDGTAFIGEALEGGLACELTAHQSCEAVGQDDPVSWTVRQTCKVTRSGNQLLIQSEIKEFLGGNFSASYLPDHFILDVKSDDLMEGSLVSYSRHPAKWTRDEGPIS